MPIQAWQFTVEGSGTFPYDMLRWDQCWPKHESNDSAMMEKMTHSRAKGPFRVTLVGLKPPTEKRWESFGWKVISQQENNRL